MTRIAWTGPSVMPVALGVKGVFVSLPWQCVSSGQAIDADQAVGYEVG